MAAESPLIVIIGPTASGKTGLSIELAKKFNGEVICADSRTVYRGMDIGTAKPTKVGMDGVVHHMLDIVDPNEKFSLWNFQQLANEKIKNIRASGKVPFLAGGSGLYVDSVIFDYEINANPVDIRLREKLNGMSLDDLKMMIKKQHIEMPENRENKRYLIRSIEQRGINRSRRETLSDNTYVVGITTNKENIERRIRLRAENMLDHGFIDEVKYLVHKYGDQEAFRNNSYGEVQKFIKGDIPNKQSLIDRMVIVDRQLAKKQITWFRRNPYIKWLELDDATEYIDKIMA